MDFVGFPKIARYSRECIVTEKIDGTNAQIYIPEIGGPIWETMPEELPFFVGSRKRWITPENDNHGFARWAYDHADELLQLGPGHHFGEWWGAKIGRKYGLDHKRFSLFNVSRWEKERPDCCHVVPVLFRGDFDGFQPQYLLDTLKDYGSFAAPGFMHPEGIVIYHVAANTMFKKTLVDDEKPKGSKEES